MSPLVLDLALKLLYFACLCGHGKVVVVPAPLGLVVVLSIIVISCHLGGAGLVPRRFKLLFWVLTVGPDIPRVTFSSARN